MNTTRLHLTKSLLLCPSHASLLSYVRQFMSTSPFIQHKYRQETKDEKDERMHSFIHIHHIHPHESSSDVQGSRVFETSSSSITQPVWQPFHTQSQTKISVHRESSCSYYSLSFSFYYPFIYLPVMLDSLSKEGRDARNRDNHKR
jgi:hypothetical protein